MAGYGYNIRQQQGRKGLRMARPFGVTVIAIICFLCAAFGGIVGGRGVLAFIHLLRARGAGGDSGLAEIGAGLILITIIFPTLYALAGYGLWNLKNWARFLTIALVAVAFGFELLRWSLATPHLIATIASLVLFLVTISYLLKPDVKAAFPASSTHLSG
jgi:hypothetical protein